MGGNGGSALRGENWTTPQAHDVTERGSGQQPTAKAGNACLARDARQWATPTSSENSNRTTKMAPSHGVTHGLVLAGQAANWPTPSAQISNDGESPETWHARAAKLKEKHGNGNGAGLPLTVAAVQWPTPAARDSKGANSEEHCTITGGGRKHMDQLSNFVAHSSHLAQPTPAGPTSSDATPSTPRRLSPLFGEWLMGWPSQWTKAEPHASSASATALWRCRLQQHLSSLLEEQACESKEAA
jgi:hypothetical protein